MVNEGLERRVFLAASIQNDTERTLLVAATRGNDEIRVVTSDVGAVIAVNGVQSSFAASEFGIIRIIAGKGNDAVTLTHETRFTRTIVVTLGAGDDSLIAGNGRVFVEAGAGNDRIAGGKLGDVISGGAGNDLIEGGGSSDSIDGNEGDDTCLGGEGHDSIRAAEGRDLVRGEGGDDTVSGNPGDDADGGAGSDRLVSFGPARWTTDGVVAAEELLAFRGLKPPADQSMRVGQKDPCNWRAATSSVRASQMTFASTSDSQTVEMEMTRSRSI